MDKFAQTTARYLAICLYSLTTLAITAGFCAVLLLTVKDFLDQNGLSSHPRVGDRSASSANTTTLITPTSLHLEASDPDRRNGSSVIRPDIRLRPSKSPNDTAPLKHLSATRIAKPTALPNVEKRTEILPLTIEISKAALTADYQSLIASGKTTSEAIRMIDQYVSEGKYGDMGKRPTTLESAESIFFSDYDRLISTGIIVDEVIKQLIENVATGRYGIYADILFQLLEGDLNRR